MYHIPGVLSPQDVVRSREQLEQTGWVNGRITTGAQGARVRNNRQVDTYSALHAALQSRVLSAVNQHALFFAAALPRTLSTPLLNRYQSNETYGFHVSGVVRSHPQNDWIRADLSATLFLDNPESCDGGKLIVSDTFGQYRVELPADNLVLHPFSSLYCVTPVTRGVRVILSTWIQSMIHDDKKRVMLFELGNNIQSLKGRYSESGEILSLLNLYHNLLREQSET